MKTLLISGYKAHELGIFKENHPGVYYIKKALEKRISQLIQDEGFEWILISGQPGTEIWAGEIVLQLQSEFSDLKLAILTPFFEQEANWKDERKEQYQSLLSHADFVDSVSRKPYENPGQLRAKNQFLVSKSDAILLLYDDEKPGSPLYYLEQAKKKIEAGFPYDIHYITPYDLDLIVQDEQSSLES